jgi:hypothetical protein
MQFVYFYVNVKIVLPLPQCEMYVFIDIIIMLVENAENAYTIYYP